MLNVFVIDDHRAFTDALRIAVETQPDLVWAGSSTTIPESWETLREREVDVVLMDVDLGRHSGIAATRQLKLERPDLRVTVLTAMNDVQVLLDAARAGADGFMGKSRPLDEILDLIRNADGIRLDESTLAVLQTRMSEVGRLDGLDWDPHLTTREREVLALLATGLDAKSVAHLLGVTVLTCRGYIRNLLSKLDAHSQLEAVVIALRTGLLADLAPSGLSGR